MKPAWRRNLAVMVVIQFVMGVAFSMMMPFLPLFVAELGVPGGHVEIWSGLVFSINFLTAALRDVQLEKAVEETMQLIKNVNFD